MKAFAGFPQLPRTGNPVPWPWSNSLAGKQRFVRLLVAMVVTLLCLGSAIALVIYTDAQSSITSENMVGQSWQILLNLGDVSRELYRTELNSLLYRQSGSEVYRSAVDNSIVVLNTLMLRLQHLVANDPKQKARAEDLGRAVGALAAGANQLTPQAGSMTELVTRCRLILNPMQDEERSRLADLQQQAIRNNLYALTRRVATIVVGTVLVLILFGFLMRDTLRRERFEEQLSETNERLRSTVQQLETQASESRLLIAARDEVALCVEVGQAEQCTVRYFEQLLPGTRGSVCMLRNSRHLLETVGSWGKEAMRISDPFSPEACCALRSGRARWRLPEKSEVHCGHFVGTPPERYLCVPLVAQGETLGIVAIECLTAESCAAAEGREYTIASLAEMTAMAIAALNLRHKLEIQSIRDGMTGLFNRSFMEIALERELHRAARQVKQIAVMMLDIDHFKQFNDTFGHEAGDVVLREVAECLRAQVRAEDIVCRYGGEEFVIILPEIQTGAAMERAELLRQTVSELALRFHGQPLRQATISIGVSIFPETGDSSETLLRSADVALYAAKRRGRNRVVLAESDGRV